MPESTRNVWDALPDTVCPVPPEGLGSHARARPASGKKAHGVDESGRGWL
jgi:hypothetical protein